MCANISYLFTLPRSNAMIVSVCLHVCVSKQHVYTNHENLLYLLAVPVTRCSSDDIAVDNVIIFSHNGEYSDDTFLSLFNLIRQRAPAVTVHVQCELWSDCGLR